MKTSSFKLLGFALLTLLAACNKPTDIPTKPPIDSTKLLAGWWAPANYLVQAKIYLGADHFFYQDTVGTKTPYAGFWTFKNKIIDCSPTSGGQPTLRFNVTQLANNKLTLSTIGVGVLQNFSKTNGLAITTPPLSIVAGNGLSIGDVGDGGPALKAVISELSQGIAVDSKNNIYISDHPGIRKVSANNGIINTLIKTNAVSICIDTNDDLYYVSADCVYKSSAATGLTTIIAGSRWFSGYNGDGLATTHYLKNVRGIAVDRQGNLFIADNGNHLVREVVAATGLMRTIAGITNVINDTGAEGAGNTVGIIPDQLAVDAKSNVYFVSNIYLRKIDAQTGNTTIVAGNPYTSPTNFKTGDNGLAKNAMFLSLTAVAVSPEGDIFVSDQRDNTVRKIDKQTHIITRFAGTGYKGNLSPIEGLHASAYPLSTPQLLALAPNGKNLYILVKGGRLLKVGPFNN